MVNRRIDNRPEKIIQKLDNILTLKIERKAKENMEYLIQKLYGRKTEKTSAINGQLVINGIEPGLFVVGNKFIRSETWYV